MQIIREVRQAKEVQPENGQGSSYTTNTICIIRTDCYGSQWSFLSKLVAFAKADFPELSDDAIRVVHFGGIRYSGTFGIEFEPPSSIPDSYLVIHELELLR